MIHAYVSPRGRARSVNAPLVIRHAVDEVSHLCGARDTACGRAVTIDMGLWVPGDPRNCVRCTAALARQEVA